MTSDMNKFHRRSFLDFYCRAGQLIVWQVKRCTKIFEAGCLPQTHGKIITSPGDRGIVGPGSGSLKAVCSQNGKDLGRVPYSGYTGNVSHLPTALTLS